MAKLVLLGLCIWLAYLILKRYGIRHRGASRPEEMHGQEDMVRCAQCGVHLPKSESTLSLGKFYCSPEHLPQDRK